MIKTDDYFRCPAADYRNCLAAAAPERMRLKNRIYILTALFAACLIPRIAISFRLDSICPDGVLYIRLAQALKEGQFSRAFDNMNLNIYPALLMVLNRLGLGWETGGMAWGIFISSLTVFPLFGWVRRQFDDQVALAACILYAVHPVFIQWSPELIRDPTFWFFFALSLYLLWRSITEVSKVISLGAGLALAMAILTRFEGLFLFIPLFLWTFWRFRALDERRDKIKLAACAALAAGVFPTLILVVNLTVLQHYAHWVSIRFTPLKLIQYWWNGTFAAAPINPAAGDPYLQKHVPLLRMIEVYLPTLVKGLSPLFGLLMLGGLWKWRRVWARRDHQPLFYVSLAIMSAAWIHAWCAKGSCDRYFLPIALMASPFAGMALLDLTGRFLAVAQRLKNGAIMQAAAVLAPTTVMAFAGICGAFSGPYDRRGAEVELADWVHRQYGPTAKIFGSEGVTPVIAYYANAAWDTLAVSMDDAVVLQKIVQFDPDVIFLSTTRRKDWRDTKDLIDKIENLNYAEIPRSDLPRETDDVLVVMNRGEKKTPADELTGGRTILRE